MSGIRKCAKCGNLMKIKNDGPEAMSPDGRFPEHVCRKCLVRAIEDEVAAGCPNCGGIMSTHGCMSGRDGCEGGMA